MKPSEYKKLRQKLGTQVEVCQMLELGIATIKRREARATNKIHKEAELAIKYLIEKYGK